MRGLTPLLLCAALAAPLHGNEAPANEAPANEAPANEAYETWPVLQAEFPSTGGGGIVIRGYAPVVEGATCRTDFQAVQPDGTTHRNTVAFDAVPVSGGILCTNGRWRSLTGDASFTTGFRVLIKDGVRRGSPE
jgi:hypothetical protein